jgi:hypothetical protein
VPSSDLSRTGMAGLIEPFGSRAEYGYVSWPLEEAAVPGVVGDLEEPVDGLILGGGK